MNRNRVFISLALLVAACPALCAQDQSLPIDRYGLRGIPAVEVLVEPLNETGASSIGLTDLRTDVELRLRSTGLRVISLQESLKTPGLETIYVNVKVLPSGEAAFAPVSLLQAVHVERNGQEVTDASTWDTGTLMTHFRATDLRDTVKDLVDQFLNDWLKQNPRR